MATLLTLTAFMHAHAADPFATETLPPAARRAMPACAAQLPPTPLSLPQALDLALCNNPQTHQAWANMRAQAAQLGVARSAYLPDANASISASRNWVKSGSNAGSSAGNVGAASASPFNERSANLTFSYLLFDFGSREANVESARQLLAAAIAVDDSVMQSILLATVQAYFQVQQGIGAVNAALQSERTSEESVKAADARYRAGKATPADKLQAQTAYSQTVLARVQAEGALKNAQGTLANAMGLDAQTAITLAPQREEEPPENFQRDVAALVEEARRRRPDLEAARAQVKAAQANIEAARAAGLPTISLSASSGRSDAGSTVVSRGSSVGINVSIPLFSGFASTYRVRAAQAQADASSAQFDRLRLQVALDVWQAYQNLLTALQSVRTTADLLASAEQSQRMVAGRYQAGVGTITDLLSAESALANARQQRVAALSNWNVSRVILAQAMGQLDYTALQSLSKVSEENSPKKEQDK